MARYLATVETPRDQQDVFAYLSDFSTTQQWDPGVAEAQRLDDGPIAVGSGFRVVAELMGRRTPLTYVVTALDAPHSITLRGENATVVSLDTIAFEQAADGGTRVSYDAELTLKGPLGLGDPLLRLVFSRIGDRAVAGLREALGAR
jgi:carbon monoxide dehydrogenase subunit G